MSGALVRDWGWMDVDHVLLSHAEPPVFFFLLLHFTSLTYPESPSVTRHTPLVKGSLYHCKPHQPGTYHFQQVSLIP